MKRVNEVSGFLPPKETACEIYFVNAERVARVESSMPSEEILQDVADTFKVLAHPSRIRIIRALAQEELCVCDLAQILGLSISATSHQLGALRKLRLVSFRTEGKLVYYRLRDAFVHALLEDGIRHVTQESAR